jgi:hypothetical protein
MKVAVIKLGARIMFGEGMGTSGGSGEASSLINMLVKGGAEVHCYTKILSKDEKPNHVVMHQIEEEFDAIPQVGYDALMVINGNVNFFGGAEDVSQILNYHIINHFPKEVFYLYCDPNLPLKQIWDSMSKKPWCSKWNKEDIEITRTIKVICQIYNTVLAKEQFKKLNVDVLSSYEFQKFPMMFPKPKPSILGRITDISYGGTFRSGRREKKLVDFYFGYPEDISVEIFGKIDLAHFTEKRIEGLTPPVFTGAVNYDKMLFKMTEALCHIVIGDNKYPAFEMISQRTYESIMAGCITFVDKEFDPNKQVFGDSELGKFLYVSDRNDVIDKIRLLKEMSKDDISALAEEQFKLVNFDETTYCNNFTKLIEENL